MLEPLVIRWSFHMLTKQLHLDRSKQPPSQSSALWFAQVVVILATLAVIAIAYGVWRMFHNVGVQPRLDDTTLPVPTPER
jgi:hypothetical protein